MFGFRLNGLRIAVTRFTWLLNSKSLDPERFESALGAQSSFEQVTGIGPSISMETAR